MRILVGTDGSKFADTAIEMVANIASSRDDVEVCIVSAYELTGPIASDPAMAIPMYSQEMIDSLERAAGDITDKAKSKLLRLCPNISVTTKVFGGRPAAVLVDEAEEWAADLIVVGSHGYGFWRRALLGSVSSAVVHHAPCSVLVVRSPDTAA